MAQSTFYSILFLDSNGNHKSPDATNGLTFFKSIDDLVNSLQTSTEVIVPVCICSSNKLNILGKLEKYSNVACVLICEEHHETLNTQNLVINNLKIKKEKFSDEPLRWQIHAHTEAFLINANNAQQSVVDYIKSIISHLTQHPSYISHNSHEENSF
ncbi:unnamed protein product [Rotaria sp. Silwood1]|nr:unnamed protein product [Rotaria sp. Silwood1]